MVSLRRVISVLLVLLSLVLVGTVLVLSTVRAYFGIDTRDLISSGEVDIFLTSPSIPYNASSSLSSSVISPPAKSTEINPGAGSGNNINGPIHEKIPRIIHQTWKTEQIPEKWQVVRDNCVAMHPDYEYILWTDKSARDFIAEHYSWFLSTYDSYPYNIQRADSMRYFVLHHYGGIYIDLDIGCKRPINPLLNFDLILARTIPVGVSNDLMFSSPKHPFMEFMIHNLMTFNHQYGSAYPTIMFSTGPMFVSLQYNLWPGSQKHDDQDSGVPLSTGTSSIRDIRILPKELYGKNASPEEAEHAFFWHLYGSSWHTDDALFVTFLGKYGTILMRVGVVLLIFGTIFVLWRRGVPTLKPRSPTNLNLPFTLPAAVTDGRNWGWAGFLASASSRSRPPTPPPPATSTSGHQQPKRPRSPGLYYFFPMWYFSSSSSSSSSSSGSGSTMPNNSSPTASSSTSPYSWFPSSSQNRRIATSLTTSIPSFRGYPVVHTDEPVSLRPLKIDVDFASSADNNNNNNGNNPSAASSSSTHNPTSHGLDQKVDPFSQQQNPESPQTPGTASKPYPPSYHQPPLPHKQQYNAQQAPNPSPHPPPPPPSSSSRQTSDRVSWFRRRRSSSATLPTTSSNTSIFSSSRPPPPPSYTPLPMREESNEHSQSQNQEQQQSSQQSLPSLCNRRQQSKSNDDNEEES